VTALLRALFVRSLRRNPVRFAVTVVGVAAGIAAMVATVAASRAAVSSMSDGVLELAGSAAVEVTGPGGVDAGLLAVLAPLFDSAVVTPVVDRPVLLPSANEAVRVLGLDLVLDAGGQSQLGDLQLAAENADLESLLDGAAVLLPATLARRLGVRAGDPITLSPRSRPRGVTVAAVFTPRTVATAWDSVVVTDVAVAQEWFGLGDRLDRIELRPRGGVDPDALLRQAAALVGDQATVAAPAARAQRGSRMVRALEFNLTALSGISLLVGAVLVATTLATSVVQRRQTIALLRSLGASHAQLTAAVLIEAGFIGVCGGTVGVLAGYLGANAASDSVRATVAALLQGVPPGTVVVAPALAAAGVALAVAVSLAAALLPLREALATPPLQGLRHWRLPVPDAAATRRTLATGAVIAAAAGGLTLVPPVDDLPLAALAASLTLLSALLVVAAPVVGGLVSLARSRLLRPLGPALRLAAAVLSEGRDRSGWAAGALGITVALAVAVTIMVHSFRQTVVDWSDQALRSDVWVRAAASGSGFGVGAMDPEVARVALELFGPEVVDPFYTTEAALDGRPVTLGAGEFRVVARRGGIPFRGHGDSRAVFARAAAEDGAVISEPLATRFGLDEGDVVRVQTAAGVVARRIVGVFYDYSRTAGMVVIDGSAYRRLFPGDGPREVALFLPDGADPAAARDRLLAALGGRYLVDAFLNRELRREVVAVFDRTFAITVALRIVAAVVAVVAVVTVLFALVAERRRDLAVVRALGGSPGQLVASVLLQAALLGLAGIVAGTGVGGLVGLVLVKIVNLQSFAWTLRFLPPWGDLAATLAWLGAACLAAGIAPALAALRVPVQEELREEG